MSGKLVIFAAPSGSGKTTIVKHLLETKPNLEFSISACNRNPRGNERNGKDYHFLSTADFKEKIKNDEFIEWEEVYPDKFYGTLKSEIDRIWKKGNVVIFDMDVVGGVNLKKEFGDRALSIFVNPPSIEVLKERLISRGTDSTEEIENRISKADEELAYSTQYDVVLNNDILDHAKTNASDIINFFLI